MLFPFWTDDQAVLVAIFCAISLSLLAAAARIGRRMDFRTGGLCLGPFAFAANAQSTGHNCIVDRNPM
jgi:hypothetical protein